MAIKNFFSDDDVEIWEKNSCRLLESACTGCGKVLEGVFICQARLWGDEHFRCEEESCGYSFAIQDTWYLYDDKVYCILHASSRSAKICGDCQLPVLEEHVEFGNKEWHPSCHSIDSDWKVRPLHLIDLPPKLVEGRWVNSTSGLVDQHTFESLLAEAMEKTARIHSTLTQYISRLQDVFADIFVSITSKALIKFTESCKMAIQGFSTLIQAIAPVEPPRELTLAIMH